MATWHDKKCLHCAIGFKVLPKNKNQKYCGQNCSQAAVVRKKDKLFNCLRCRQKLAKQQYKFCSKSCSTTWYNSQRSYENPSKPKCLTCGNETRRISAKYCSNKCLRISEGILVKPIKKKDPQSPFNCTCKHCGVKFQSQRCRHYCSNHVNLYSHNGRARYWFTINVYNYPELFDLEDLKRIGFRSKTNLNGYTRDHKVSVNHAIRYSYDPYYITHVMNCELMLWNENNKKNTNSSISYDELVQLVNEYDSKVGRRYRT